jgi:hypothetical protein
MKQANYAVAAYNDDNAVEIANVATETTVAPQPAANSASVQAPTVKYVQGIRDRLSALSADAASWEANAYASANEGLYALMQRCYELYKELTNTADVNLKYKKQGLAEHLSANGMESYNDKPLPQRIIRCVFGDRDRRRISTYNVVLRVIVAEQWAVADVPASIAARGGVQEMSLGRKPGTLTSKEKAESVAATVQTSVLASVKTTQTDKFANNEKIGEKFAAVLTQEADGSFSINCIVSNKAAVTAALTAFYNAEKAKADAAKPL